MYSKLQKAINRRTANRLRTQDRFSQYETLKRNWQPNQSKPGSADYPSPDSADNCSREHRERLLKVLNRCSEKLSQGQKKKHDYISGDDCDVVKGKYYGARGIIRDIDFIHSRILVDIKSYKEPVWLSLSEVSPA